MMKMRTVFQILSLGFMLGGCQIDDNRRDPTMFDFSEFSPVLVENYSTIDVVDGDESPVLCEECESLRSAVSSILGSGDSGLLHGLQTIDTRIETFRQRTADHYVPCLEGSGAALTEELATDISIRFDGQCIDFFEDPNDDENLFFEQALLGRTGDDRKQFVAV